MLAKKILLRLLRLKWGRLGSWFRRDSVVSLDQRTLSFDSRIVNWRSQCKAGRLRRRLWACAFCERGKLRLLVGTVFERIRHSRRIHGGSSRYVCECGAVGQFGEIAFHRLERALRNVFVFDQLDELASVAATKRKYFVERPRISPCQPIDLGE